MYINITQGNLNMCLYTG